MNKVCLVAQRVTPPLAVSSVNPGTTNCAEFRVPEVITVQVCKKCMRTSVDLNQIPDDLISVFIGRVVRTDRENYNRRIVQIQPNYPQDVSKEILKFSFYHPIKKGDRVAVAGSISTNWIEPVLVRNVSADSEKTGGKVVAEVRLRIEGRRDLVVDSPLVMKARRRIDEMLKSYEQQIEKTITPSEHEVSASEFEMLVADLFERLGFQNVRISGGPGDKGVDIEASRVDENSERIFRTIIQCKHQNILHRVMPTQIRDFAHTIEREKKDGVQRGYFVTSSYFSPECFDKENCGNDMELIDRDHLETLLRKVGLPIPKLR